MLSKEISMPIRAAPYEHQQAAFKFVCDLFGLMNEPKSPGAALLMEMGTGKTITSIAIAGALSKSSKIRKVLIVAPLSLLGVWEEEFVKFADFEYSLTVLTGTGVQKAKALRLISRTGLQVVVVNYESVWRLEEELSAWAPDLIIADEGHKIKTHSIAASKAMHRLCARTRYRLLLTGTVITNKAIDVFSQYKFLNPRIFGQSFFTFRNRYFDMTGYGNHTPVLKSRWKAS
jgi:SNF2 family DNA or RNA helicase